MLIGSGGAARAIAFALGTVDPIPELQILGVEAGEREKLERDLRERTELAVSSGSLSEKTLEEAMAWAEVVVHATPVGMNPKAGQSLVPSDLIEPRHAVFDVVYNPLETRLLREAKVRGARTVPGLGMFVHQGAIQFELWTGLKPPLGVMYDTVKKALG